MGGIITSKVTDKDTKKEIENMNRDEWKNVLINLEQMEYKLSKTSIILIYAPEMYDFRRVLNYISDKTELPVYSTNQTSMASIDTSNLIDNSKNGCIVVLSPKSSDSPSEISAFYTSLSTYYFVIPIILKVAVDVRI
jgi:hypothetical protein